MKTSLDLPEPLVRELERRAAHAGQNLTQAAAELLWKGLAASPDPSEPPPRATVKAHPTTGLPYIECSHAAAAGAEVTPDRVTEILLEQEATWHDEAGR